VSALAAALALLGLLSGPAGGEAPAAEQARIERGARHALLEDMRRELSSVMDELSAKLHRLETVQGRYLGGDFRAARTEREQLLSEIRPLFGRFKERQGEFNNRRELYEALDVVQGRRELAGVGAHEMVRGFAPERRKGMPAPDGAWLVAWHELDAFRDAMTGFRKRTSLALKEEEESLRLAEAERRSRLRLMLACSGLLAAAVLAAVLARRKFGPMRP